MKKIFLLLFTCLLVANCVGFSPIFSGDKLNFYIGNIVDKNETDFSRKLIKKLEPYSKSKKDKKNKIDLFLDTSYQENITSKDSRGNPLTFEAKISIIVDFVSNEKTIKKTYVEIFNFNNQSNKFELVQYKKSLLDNFAERVFEKIFLDLGTF